jgi:hypothetical protein
LTSREQRTFVTKSYFDETSTAQHASTSDLNSKIFAPAFTAYSHGVAGLDKSYPVSGTDVAQNKAALFAANTSDFQNRTANLGTQKTETYASPLSNKSYLGPESAALHQEMSQVNDELIHLKDLPDRPLTIDEVRALINHGVTPDTDAKPEPNRARPRGESILGCTEARGRRIPSAVFD